MEAMEIFNNFTDKYLHGNIEELRTYDFSKVISKEYGNGKSYADGDCTKIAYAIYYLLWKDKQIPLFTESNFEKLTNSYSGDTINTFNTLFGKEDSARKKIQAIFSEDEQKIVEDFKILYQTIGNFYVLPKNTIFYRTSLNKYRGVDEKYLDYFDLFLKNLNEYFNNPELCDQTLKKLIEKNSFFFEKCKSLNQFLSYFDLENYLQFDLGENHYAYWLLNESNVEEYKTFSLNYIQKASEQIKNRTEKIINKLGTFYNK